jgi:hypothetical protein
VEGRDTWLEIAGTEDKCDILSVHATTVAVSIVAGDVMCDGDRHHRANMTGEDLPCVIVGNVGTRGILRQIALRVVDDGNRRLVTVLIVNVIIVMGLIAGNVGDVARQMRAIIGKVLTTGHGSDVGRREMSDAIVISGEVTGEIHQEMNVAVGTAGEVSEGVRQGMTDDHTTDGEMGDVTPQGMIIEVIRDVGCHQVRMTTGSHQ